MKLSQWAQPQTAMKSILTKMSEVSFEQLQEELQSFSQVCKEISSTAMIKMATSIPKEESFEEYMEISEQLKAEGFIAEVPPGTTALVSTDTVAACVKRNEPCKVCIPCAFKTLHL